MFILPGRGTCSCVPRPFVKFVQVTSSCHRHETFNDCFSGMHANREKRCKRISKLNMATRTNCSIALLKIIYKLKLLLKNRYKHNNWFYRKTEGYFL